MELRTVSKELQRTHIHFDGLGNVFGTLSAEIIAGEVEGHQHPGGSGDIVEVGHRIFWIFCHLLALANGSNGMFADCAATDIQQPHWPCMKLKHTC